MSELPGLGGMPPGADPGPIQADLVRVMNALAHGVDEIFNGPGCKAKDRQVWFFLAAGNFADHETPDTGRFNYISNADKLDVRAALHEILARLETRIADGGGT